MFDFKELLSEEKNLGSRMASSYKVDAFEKIDKELQAIADDDTKMDLRDEAKSELENNEDSIILNYIVGRISLMLRPHEYSMRLNNLLLSFYEAGNWDVVKYIGALILSAGESSKALRVLGDVADQMGNEDEKWDYYERLVRSDSSDKEIIIVVADHFEAKGDKQKAMNYYQRALLRLQKADDETHIVDIFRKLLDNGRTGYPFYSSFAENETEKNPELGKDLYLLLLSYVTKERDTHEAGSSEYRRNLDNTIEISRRILTLTPDDMDVRNALIEAIKLKYSESQRLSECLKHHNILSKDKDPVKTLSAFEKDIAFSVGTYVFQKATRRVGLIIKVEKRVVTVRYSATDTQEIKLESAFDALTPLTKQNLKVIKKGVPAPKIKAKIMGEGGIAWLVRTLLYSAADNKETLKEMKNDVVPSILTESEWKEISDKIKLELRDNSYIRIIPGSTDVYQLMAYPSTPEEKQLYIFRGETTFYGRVDAIINALSNKQIEKSSDAFMEMVSYFQDQLSSEKTQLSIRIASVLLLDYLSEKEVPVSFDVSFDSLYRNLEESEIKEIFAAIDSTVLKKEFVDAVIDYDKAAAADTLVLIFPEYINSYIPTKLRRLRKGVVYYALIKKTVESFRDAIPSFIFFSCEANLSDSDLQKADVTRDQIFRAELMALSHIAKAADNQENRKNIKTLRKALVDDRAIDRFLSSASREDIDDARPLILFNGGLENDEKASYKSKILSRFPDYDFNEKKPEPVKPQSPKVVSGFLCTEASYNRKKDELKDINTVQMPEILKEINFARELGDLRENSEYQYAKEHKRELERRIGELNNDLTTVRVMTPSDVLPDLIGFGTRVTLRDRIENKEVVYTFMGRWESNPEEGIIDFNAPLGQKLVNHKTGDDVQFEINGRQYDYEVLKIEVLDF
ncbi:MAG: transcription elongation factor GreA [Spirochaetes bacterium]|uniref:Transcription elongation factor GreA n=1 Tax=Candidatus Ornithospirochaeta stercoravium TaxID=2840897 RepID=A0A9D9NC10_9SPIO|nr:transcription elongation factor GreA [Candidatus Ornithospirochaeta stercoravium]